MIAHIKTYVKIIINIFYISYMYMSLTAIKLGNWYEKVVIFLFRSVVGPSIAMQNLIFRFNFYG
jgi:hypothetical protein